MDYTPMRMPPLNAIRAFEAVCRHGSISKAAEELGVVRGAIRHQISTLEGYFGQKLFERSGKTIVPLAAAMALAEAATSAFDIIARAAAELEQGERTSIRLGVPSAFAIWWLMPRIADLQKAMGAIEIAIVPMAAAEPLAIHPDLDGVIMGGEYRPAVGITSFRFMEDEFGPVVSSEMAARMSGDQPNFGELTLLRSKGAPRLWDDWVSESGERQSHFAREQLFEDLVLAIGAARSGLGVVVAPKASIETDLARGELVAPFGFIRRPAGYSFCCRTSDAKTEPFTALTQWLRRTGCAQQ